MAQFNIINKVDLNIKTDYIEVCKYAILQNGQNSYYLQLKLKNISEDMIKGFDLVYSINNVISIYHYEDNIESNEEFFSKNLIKVNGIEFKFISFQNVKLAESNEKIIRRLRELKKEAIELKEKLQKQADNTSFETKVIEQEQTIESSSQIKSVSESETVEEITKKDLKEKNDQKQKEIEALTLKYEEYVKENDRIEKDIVLFKSKNEENQWTLIQKEKEINNLEKELLEADHNIKDTLESKIHYNYVDVSKDLPYCEISPIHYILPFIAIIPIILYYYFYLIQYGFAIYYPLYTMPVIIGFICLIASLVIYIINKIKKINNDRILKPLLIIGNTLIFYGFLFTIQIFTFEDKIFLYVVLPLIFIAPVFYPLSFLLKSHKKFNYAYLGIIASLLITIWLSLHFGFKIL